MAARWRGGRDAIEDFEKELKDIQWGLNREVLLRITSVLAVGSPNHIRLLGLQTEDQWRDCWAKTESAVRDAVQFIRDDADVRARGLLPTEYVVLLPAVFLHDRRGALEPGDAKRLAQWLYLASAFAHYSGSLETRLAADVNVARDAARTDALGDLTRMAQEPRTRASD